MSGRLVRHAGFTAIEVLIVLIVGLAILALSSGKFSMIFGDSAIVEEVGTIATMGPSIRSMRTISGYGAAGGDMTANMAAAHAIPNNVPIVSGVMYNAWGGTLVPISSGLGFTIASSSIPMNGCIKVVTKIARSGAYNSIQINANTAIVGDVSSAVATAQCTDSLNNTITYLSSN